MALLEYTKTATAQNCCDVVTIGMVEQLLAGRFGLNNYNPAMTLAYASQIVKFLLALSFKSAVIHSDVSSRRAVH